MQFAFDYQFYAILEVLANRESKKFIPNEIYEDIKCNEFIIKEAFSDDIKTIEKHIQIFYKNKDILSSYDDIDDLLHSCVKYKKQAYKIGYGGIILVRQYIEARKLFITGFMYGAYMSDNKPCCEFDDKHLCENPLFVQATSAWFGYVFKENLAFGAWVTEQERNAAILHGDVEGED